MSIPVLEVLRHFPQAMLPLRAYKGSAGYDLHAFLLNDVGRPMTATISPRSTKVIGTGLGLKAPSGHVILVCSRGGLAQHSVFVANAPGVVDPEFTGQIKVALYNGGMDPAYVKHGDRIAQALLVPFAAGTLVEVAQFEETDRGARGFGSSGD